MSRVGQSVDKHLVAIQDGEVAPVAAAGVAGGQLRHLRGPGARRLAGVATLGLALWFLAQGLWLHSGALPLPFCGEASVPTFL